MTATRIAPLHIERLDEAGVEDILLYDGGNGWMRDRATWEVRLRAAMDGERVVLVARVEGQAAGYGSLLWRSQYRPFSEAGIPEIHDLVVAQAFRGQGIARRMITEFERLARGRGCDVIGIGVGLYSDYGAAQRLYPALGFCPDGRGVTYAGAPVKPGARVPVDDDLILWFTKPLGA